MSKPKRIKITDFMMTEDEQELRSILRKIGYTRTTVRFYNEDKKNVLKLDYKFNKKN